MSDALQALHAMHARKPWDDLCAWAEQHYPPLADHLATWGPHCGAPRAVYRGHLIRLLLDLSAEGHP